MSIRNRFIALQTRLLLRGIPRRPKRVLFLCTGNTCRSPMAENLLRTFGLGIEAGSGSALYDGRLSRDPIAKETLEVLRSIGISGAHKGTVAKPEVVIALDSPGSRQNFERSQRLYGPRVIQWEVMDPFCRGRDAYEATYKKLRVLFERDLGVKLPEAM